MNYEIAKYRRLATERRGVSPVILKVASALSIFQLPDLSLYFLGYSLAVTEGKCFVSSKIYDRSPQK